MELQDEPIPPDVPPTVDHVVRRAFCLSAVICRSFIDEHSENEHFQAVNAGMLRWLADVGAEAELEPWERAVLTQPLGTIDVQTRVNATWVSEGLVVLAWALGVYDLPPHDECVDPMALTNELRLLQPTAAELANRASLRSFEEIQIGAERAFAIHWRVRNFSLESKPMNFAEFSRTAWFGPLNIEGVILAEADLSIAGVPISRANPDDIRTAKSIAMERHKAFNWLLGQSGIYSETDTST